MGNKYFLFLISIVISLGTSCQGKKVINEGYIVKVGDKAPDFTIKEAGGKTYKLSDLKGKVVMLQFTASWCSVCRTEMPFIEKEAGVTRNVIIDRNGEIIFLTRLYKREEFDQMKKVIFAQLAAK